MTPAKIAETTKLMTGTSPIKNANKKIIRGKRSPFAFSNPHLITHASKRSIKKGKTPKIRNFVLIIYYFFDLINIKEKGL